ncbi:hypothetical protein BB560_004638 [Smittium megazygosporum]|uniref:Uncharacterized protein n=1 Tax=Smittium megazygosporum TaxID=133381 RepID=A0A2T9Z8N1_9FUNG|nr:hypothetical protein BB560_004638 [Smittium megazygosporum]
MSEESLEAIDDSIDFIYSFLNELTIFKKDFELFCASEDLDHLKSAYNSLTKLMINFPILKSLIKTCKKKLKKVDKNQINKPNLISSSHFMPTSNDLLLSKIKTSINSDFFGPSQDKISTRISSLELFDFLENFRLYFQEVEIYVYNVETSNEISVRFQFGEVIALTVTFGSFNEDGMAFSNLSLPGGIAFEIGGFHVSSTSPNVFSNLISTNGKNSPAKESKILTIIQSQVDYKWNHCVLSSSSEIMKLAKMLLWFQTYFSLYRSPCMNCKKILKYEPTVAQWVPPVLRIQSSESSSEYSSVVGPTIFNPFHLSCI